MKTNKPDIQMFESTYAMLMRSEEKERSASEIVAYGLLIVSACFAMWQIALHPFTVPTNLIRGATTAAHSAPTAQPAV
ncbi:MAG: hypothetical protein M3032_11690 [Verrucomicrobiota bacterium]|nr:hypothetical protein [Verrucomicrobiota bacterium]